MMCHFEVSATPEQSFYVLPSSHMFLLQEVLLFDRVVRSIFFSVTSRPKTHQAVSIPSGTGMSACFGPRLG